MRAHPEGEVLRVRGSEDQQCISSGDNRGRTEVVEGCVIRLEKLSRHEVPCQHILAPPISVLIGGKQEICFFEQRDDRIGGCPVPALLDKIRDVNIGVIEVERIAVGLSLRQRRGNERHGECTRGQEDDQGA